MSSKAKAAWTYTVGVSPYQVTAFEDKRSGHVTLRWYERVGPKQLRRVLRSTGFPVRGARGGIDRDAEARAIAAANQWHRELAGGTWSRAPKARTVGPSPLTIREGWARAKDPDKGKWNHDTTHRDDIQRAIDRACLVWGEDFTWDAVDRGALRQLWRRELARLRAQGHGGFRGAELQLDLVLAVGAWLRDEQLISPTAALRWKGMMDEFKKDAGEHTPRQPRYTVAEYRKLFVSAWQADERWGLLYDLAAEYRIGQVASARRRDLDRERGRLRIKGHGKKKGEVIFFTEAQAANVAYVLEQGYLAGLERAFSAGDISDYPLFPGGHFAADDEGRLVSRAEYATRAPVDRSAWRAWHREAERLAGIPHLPGRGPYGSRRGGVDAAKELQISREGLRAWGGWVDQQMPDRTYADQEAEYARDEASRIRAQARGAAVGPGASRLARPTESPPSEGHELPEVSRDTTETPNGAPTEVSAPFNEGSQLSHSQEDSDDEP